MAEFSSLIHPTDVLEEAQAVAGFLSFLVLAGVRLNAGRSRLVYGVFLGLGLSRERAWQVVDGWGFAETTQAYTGWQPELVAAAVVIHDLPYTWRDKGWVGLAARLA